MRPSFSPPVVRPLILVLVAAAVLWVTDVLYGKKEVQMTHVGGTMNQCTCSQRLER